MRQCLIEPTPALFDAAAVLSAAVDAHLNGDFEEAGRLIRSADSPQVRAFTESAWGPGGKQRLGFVHVAGALPRPPSCERPVPRMPTTSTRSAVVERDGFHCRFCGLPVIPPLVRQLIRQAYPEALSWGPTNASQHAAFQCMWLQFDHILPNSRGGASTCDNIVVTCAPCNFGRMETTLEEAMLANPLLRPTPQKWDGFNAWDGLERFCSPALQRAR
jgi:5-methylcytosine-specific restriction endonuclease McrA